MTTYLQDSGNVLTTVTVENGIIQEHVTMDSMNTRATVTRPEEMETMLQLTLLFPANGRPKLENVSFETEKMAALFQLKNVTKDTLAEHLRGKWHEVQ